MTQDTLSHLVWLAEILETRALDIVEGIGDDPCCTASDALACLELAAKLGAAGSAPRRYDPFAWLSKVEAE